MTRWIWALFLILPIAAGVVVFALSFRLHEKVHVGGVFDLEENSSGKDEYRAADLAFEEWRKREQRSDIRFIFRDAPAADPSAIIKAFSDLVDDGAVVIVAPSGDRAALALASYADRDDVIVVVPKKSGAPNADCKKRYVFPIFTQKEAGLGFLAHEDREEVLERFEKEYGARPDWQKIIFAFEATRFVLETIAGGSREPRTIRDAFIESGRFNEICPRTISR